MRQEALDAVEAVCKSAAGFTDVVQAQHGSLMRQDAMQQLGRLLLVGAGAGMGARGLLGLAQLTKRNLKPPKPLGGGPIRIDVPVPGMAPAVEDEEKLAADKTAGGLTDFLQGDYAKNPSGIPWMIPATVLGGGASIYGGWKLMDSILDARRKQELKGDVDDARNDFQQALMSEFHRPTTVPKVASAEPTLAEDLETIFVNVKSAGFLEDALHGTGIATGIYGTAAGAAGIAAALGAYNATRKRREQALMQKAYKIQQRRRWSQQPPPIIAHPVPMPTDEEPAVL